MVSTRAFIVGKDVFFLVARNYFGCTKFLGRFENRVPGPRKVWKSFSVLSIGNLELGMGCIVLIQVNVICFSAFMRRRRYEGDGNTNGTKEKADGLLEKSET